MNPRKWTVIATLTLTLTTQACQKQQLAEKAKPEEREEQRELAPDQPGEEENLNKELWEFVKKDTPYPTFLAKAQAKTPQEMSLPNGWKISPAGTQIEVGRLPYEAINYAGKLVVLNTGYYGKEPQNISVIDTKNAKVIKTLPYQSLFPSAKQSPDSDLYISGGFDQKIYRINKEFNPVREYPIKGYAAGIAPIDNKRLAVNYLVTQSEQKNYTQGKLAILNTETGAIEQETNVGYFPYSVEFLNNKLYVILIGENKLLIYDKQLKPIKTLTVGQKPQNFCVDGQNLYVLNTASDSISVIDTKKDVIVSNIDVRHKGFRSGSSPTSCVIEGNRLYVTQAEINAVAVFDKNKKQLQGFIPSAWYPTKVLLNQGQMSILSAKGIHLRRPNLDGVQPITSKGGKGYVLKLLKGSVSLVPQKQINASLKNWTKQVEEGSPIYSAKEGLKLPIRHIFYIVKENRTYDQILGDLEKGNGDKSLTLFGREVTPNHHKLASDFVTLDNFFVNGEMSVLGHSFTTSGYASPFLEWLGNAKYSLRYKGYPFGTVPATFSPVYLWNALEAKKVDYRIYGEPYYIFTRSYQLIVEAFGADSQLAQKFYAQSMSSAAKTDRGQAATEVFKDYYGKADTPQQALRLLENTEFTNSLSKVFTNDDTLAKALQKYPNFRKKFAKYLYHYPFNYHYYDLKYSDIQRAQDWKTDFEKQLKTGKVSQFNYIWLPNDHTAGENPDYPNPYQLMAQNDAALGKIVETIAKSPIWKNSLILVVEDDAQDGPDHVDATRTVALAVSPYVKRNVVVNDRYDQLSMLKTIELILGLDPMNMSDGLATPMFGIFDKKPNNSAYVPAKPSDYLIDEDKLLYSKIRN
ncbi:MAG: bifunctional YncE family protein/alkaline phosphatase family protein [Scytonematopsis contorta HA4267-MV1]|jgi:DNA-binding beta-propeller fold protein YncE|nr:bifunctional YncE family protein/alkaline phosphatase family protein [Scytonematopsis contorta HA4267-MV1]